MGLGSIKNDFQHYPDLELSPALYNIGPSYSFFRSVLMGKKEIEVVNEKCVGVNRVRQGALHKAC